MPRYAIKLNQSTFNYHSLSTIDTSLFNKNYSNNFYTNTQLLFEKKMRKNILRIAYSVIYTSNNSKSFSDYSPQKLIFIDTSFSNRYSLQQTITLGKTIYKQKLFLLNEISFGLEGSFYKQANYAQSKVRYNNGTETIIVKEGIKLYYNTLLYFQLGTNYNIKKNFWIGIHLNSKLEIKLPNKYKVFSEYKLLTNFSNINNYEVKNRTQYLLANFLFYPNISFSYIIF